MKLADEFNGLNNKRETFDSGEYAYFKPEQYTTSQIKDAKKRSFSQAETGVEEARSGKSGMAPIKDIKKRVRSGQYHLQERF